MSGRKHGLDVRHNIGKGVERLIVGGWQLAIGSLQLAICNLR